ncbi:phosphatidylglycerol/phosphatidylinositol transfer protein precursor [Delphinella strobiligena]|nr:phosphatidylglycerol/phosphatidylinositol transfer protein precursor [Delphinella strobiligena]
MRVSNFLSLATALLTASASARSLSLFSGEGSQHALEETFPVPGDNPLLFCAKPESPILEIESVDLSPNPPAAGTTLTIKASGIFTEDVEEGAKVHLQVKYGLIRIINQEADLCENIKNVDLECPLKKGPMSLTKDVELPKEIPPGKYTVLADVYTKDQKKITCLTATVVFKRGGAVEIVN